MRVCERARVCVCTEAHHISSLGTPTELLARADHLKGREETEVCDDPAVPYPIAPTSGSSADSRGAGTTCPQHRPTLATHRLVGVPARDPASLTGQSSLHNQQLP